jgi:hypothetical protein
MALPGVPLHVHVHPESYLGRLESGIEWQRFRELLQ